MVREVPGSADWGLGALCPDAVQAGTTPSRNAAVIRPGNGFRRADRDMAHALPGSRGFAPAVPRGRDGWLSSVFDRDPPSRSGSGTMVAPGRTGYDGCNEAVAGPSRRVRSN